MKSSILCMAMLLCIVSAKAQSNTPEIKKGYYSIYHNADKLAKGKTIVACEQHQNKAVSGPRKATPVTKGYYAIGNNKARQRGLDSNAIIISCPSKPKASKGYYSIH